MLVYQVQQSPIPGSLILPTKIIDMIMSLVTKRKTEVNLLLITGNYLINVFFSKININIVVKLKKALYL